MVIDVLRFTTAVDVAVARGATIIPRRELDPPARTDSRYSLSPASLLTIPAGVRLELASPNGATISLVAAEASAQVFAGCLRNAAAVAAAARGAAAVTTVIAAGERWGSAGPLRPAFEDLVGAGAVLAALRPAAPSPEARAAIAAFQGAAPDLKQCLRTCSSGRELREKGFHQDIVLAAALDVSRAVPILRAGAFTDAGGPA